MPDRANLGDGREVSIAMDEECVVPASELCDAAVDGASDDAASVCFDTEPLEAPLELLGRPAVDIAFSADRPVAQLCFRLSDEAPGGASQRITYRVFNLTHHAGPEAPAVLESGRFYRARIELNECAHRLRAGHRLRLAVSTSYWPVVWLSPAVAAVTLDLAQCRLVLPERRASDEVEPAAPGRAGDFPVHAAEALREPANRTERRIEPDGTHVLETFDDVGASRDLEHGLESGSHVAQRCAIHPDDPLSARHEARRRYEFRRGNWSVRIDSASMSTRCRGARTRTTSGRGSNARGADTPRPCPWGRRSSTAVPGALSLLPRLGHATTRCLIQAWSIHEENAMPLLTEGSPAPAFSVPNQDGTTVSLGQLAGKWVVLWWYPKADTPG